MSKLKGCFYCGVKMFDRRRETNRQAQERFGIPVGGYLSRKRLNWCRKTKEHLKRRVDGGGNGRGNVVHACVFCNSTRHGATPEHHRAMMESLKRQGRHPCHMTHEQFIEIDFRKTKWRYDKETVT